MENKLISLLTDIGLAVSRHCFKAFFDDIDLNSEVKTSPADIIYRIDVEAEEEIIRILSERAGEFGGIILLAEGIGEDDKSIFPAGTPEEKAAVKIICDPVDGSRGLMFAKRPAFFLASAGDALSRNLSDMTVSVMVEIPIPKQGAFDVLTAVKGKGTECFRYRMNGESRPLSLKPLQSENISGGFISFVKYCYPGKDYIAMLEERFLDDIFAGRKEHFLPVFEDQYISNGGQLYEMICGHDLLIFDARAAMYAKFAREGKNVGQISHPYDMAGLMVAEEAGLIITNLDGSPFDAPLDMTYDVDWIGYANTSIRCQCEPVLRRIMKEEGLI